MKKLNLKTPFFQEEQLLTRSQLKKVLGGYGGGGGYSGGGMCLYCATETYGGSCWYRKNTSTNGTDECKKIYPNETSIEGGFSACASGCTMN